MASVDLTTEMVSESGMGVPSPDELLHLDPDRFVARYTDIAAVNLACARGLSNTEESEFPQYLTLLDTIAEAVRRETDRSRRLFKIKPAQFHNSEAVFRMYTMEHVFRTRFRIRYDSLVEETIKSRRRWNTSDSSEIFIHGILSDKRTGTCSSLPTFAIAVGRRLGYPLKLVLVPHHTLYRWDDGDEVFNLQHTEAGGEIRSDESIHEWPVEWTPEDFAMNKRTKVWLHSMTLRQEVSLLDASGNSHADVPVGDAQEAHAASPHFSRHQPCLRTDASHQVGRLESGMCGHPDGNSYVGAIPDTLRTCRGWRRTNAKVAHTKAPRSTSVNEVSETSEPVPAPKQPQSTEMPR